LTAPTGSLAEFGIEVAIGENILAGGSRYAQSGTLTERVAIAANPKPFSGLDLWAEGKGLASAQPETDLENDGLIELLEYVFNLDPNVPDAGVLASGTPLAGQPVVLAGAQGGFEFQFVRPLADWRLTTQVETSADLATWNPLTTVPTVRTTFGGYQLCSVPLPAGSDQTFARLRLFYNRR
jgi:hypothetical protein